MLFAANSAWALQCGRNLIAVGDSKYEVLSRCGDPAYREFLGVETARKYTKRKDLKVEVWVYTGKSLGRGELDHQLTFVGLELVEIKPIRP